MLPKKLHYVWFGGGAHSEDMKATIANWKALMPDHEVIEWNETNIDVTSHPWMHRMHSERKFAFASDYARLMVLRDHGGIYLDTDIQMKKSLSPYRSERCFISFEFDHFIAMCIIGAEPGHQLIKDLLAEYDHLTEPIINNILVTRHLFRNYPEFRLGNGDQMIGDGIHVFPKEYFILPSFRKHKNFSVHHANNQWQTEKKRPGVGQMIRSVIGDVLYMKLYNIKMGMNTTFWEEERSRRKK